jgi:hypothetical protein
VDQFHELAKKNREELKMSLRNSLRQKQDLEEKQAFELKVRRRAGTRGGGGGERLASNGRVRCGPRVTADGLDDSTGVMEIRSRTELALSSPFDRDVAHCTDLLIVV